MVTPMAQQSTGLPYLCLPTTSGAIRESLNYDNESNTNIKYNIVQNNILYYSVLRHVILVLMMV